MKKTLTINCGNVHLIKDRNGMLDGYDSIIVNCGSATITDEIYAVLMKKGAVINVGSTEIIPTPANPVRLREFAILDENSNYQGMYLLCPNMLVKPNGAKALATLEGAATGFVYVPDTLDVALSSSIRARQVHTYPAGAEFIIGDMRLEQDSAGRCAAKTVYVENVLYAQDERIVETLAGSKFICRELVIGEKAFAANGGMFTYQSLTVIPDGYGYAPKSAPLIDLYANCGERIYLRDDLEIAANDEKNLARIRSIIAKGTVRVPVDMLAEAKAVVQADCWEVVEGNRIEVMSFQMMNKDFFCQARETGMEYTFSVKGTLVLGDDVTAEDVQVIRKLQVSGTMLAPGATHPHLMSAGRISGTLLGSPGELKRMYDNASDQEKSAIAKLLPSQFAELLGFSSNGDWSNTMINAGNHYMI